MFDISSKNATVQICLSEADLRAFGLGLLQEYRMQEEQRKQAEKDSETYLTTKQVCELLHIDRSSLWRWEKDGYLTPSSIGGRKRYSKTSINKILEERK